MDPDTLSGYIAPREPQKGSDRLDRPSLPRLALIVTAGLVGILCSVVLLPKGSPGNALDAVARSQPPSQSRHASSSTANSTVTTSSPTSTTSTTVVTIPPAPASPSAVPAPAPTTTVPQPAPAPAPAPTPAPAKPTPKGIIPPQNPSSNIAPSPNFLDSCSGSAYDDSNGCVNATLAAIANARAAEGLGPMTLPSNWNALSPQEQLFVATNLERTARGLPPLTAMVSGLDAASAQAASANTDPEPPGGFGFVQWGSNWAGAVGNPLEAIYYWMYDDGPGSSNVDCTPADSSGCWGHRDNVLLGLSCSNCVMGTGYVPTAYQNSPSWTEILVEATSSSPVDFSWLDA